MERKLLYTASTYSHISNFHLPYLAAFQAMGWKVHVACGGAPASIPGADRVIPVPFEKRMTSPKNITAARLLRREIVQERYALISTHTSLAAFFTRLAVRGLRERPAVVNTSHGYLFDDDSSATKRALLLGAERLNASCTDLIMTMNRWDDEVARAKHLGAQVLSIPGMGVEFTRLSAPKAGASAALRGEFGFNEGSFLLVYAAEFSGRKHQETLIRALPHLPDRVGLLLPGSGALWADSAALARVLGVEGRVVLPGQVRDMERWYAAADAAASASRSEGLPFHLMEAMYLGLPVVASAVKGNADLIRDGENGLLYPYGDSAAFAARVCALLEQPGLGARLAAAAALDAEQYRLDAVLPQVMAAYQLVLPALEPAPMAER